VKITRLLCVSMLLMAACQIPPVQSRELVVGYYPAWNRENYPASKIPFQHLTHIAHAFIWPESNGSLATYDHFIYPDLLQRARAAGCRVIISIGGWGQSDGFASVAASAALRKIFIDNVVLFCRNNGYQGVDLDWEYPQPGVERSNFTKLVAELRTALLAADSSWTLSFVVPADTYSANRFDYAAVRSLVDWVGCMSYDFHGSWTDHAGHNAPLYAPAGEAEGSIHNAIQYLTARVPAGQVLLGIPFYGKEFLAAGLYQASGGCDDVVYQKIPELLKSGYSYHWDDVARVPFLQNQAKTKIVTFDDTVSVGGKCEYLKSKKLGGVIIWALGQDDLGSSQPLLAAIDKKLHSPNGITEKRMAPDRIDLLQNYPNPFNAETTIPFILPQTANVKIEIMNVLGRRMAVLCEQMTAAGSHSVRWDGRAMDGAPACSGVYFCRLQAGDFVKTVKMILML
jgi:chitinase